MDPIVELDDFFEACVDDGLDGLPDSLQEADTAAGSIVFGDQGEDLPGKGRGEGAGVEDMFQERYPVEPRLLVGAWSFGVAGSF